MCHQMYLRDSSCTPYGCLRKQMDTDIFGHHTHLGWSYSCMSRLWPFENPHQCWLRRACLHYCVLYIPDVLVVLISVCFLFQNMHMHTCQLLFTTMYPLALIRL